jgi:hypothetical protein
MEAPVYPPATRFEQPVKVARPLSTADSSFAELLADPAAKAIFLSEVPDFERRVSNPMLAPHLGNMSPRSLAQFGLFKIEALDRIDAKLRALYGQEARP